MVTKGAPTSDDDDGVDAPRLSRNVPVNLVSSLFNGMSRGIWGSAVLSPYLLLLKGNVRYVGYAEGAQGLLQALVAVPIGMASDRGGKRHTWLRMAGVLGAVAAVFTSVVLLYPFGHAAKNALFSDSIPTGQRSKWQMIARVLTIVGASAGPLANIIVFTCLGNDWTESSLQVAFISGMGVSLVVSALCFVFSDDRALGKESEALKEEEEDTLSKMEASSRLAYGCIPRSAIIPCIITSDLLFGLASGATIKFFPIWFEKDIQLKPAALNGVVMASRLLMAFLSWVTQRLSIRMGRMQTSCLAYAIGMGCLLAMILLDGVWATQPFLLSALYVIRTALMNSTYSLRRSALFDVVKKKHRATVASFESITSFGWSGSALLGGLMIDRWSFRTCFIITLTMQFMAVLPLAFIIPLVPLESRTASIVRERTRRDSQLEGEALLTLVDVTSSEEEEEDGNGGFGVDDSWLTTDPTVVDVRECGEGASGGTSVQWASAAQRDAFVAALDDG